MQVNIMPSTGYQETLAPLTRAREKCRLYQRRLILGNVAVASAVEVIVLSIHDVYGPPELWSRQIGGAKGKHLAQSVGLEGGALCIED